MSLKGPEIYENPEAQESKKQSFMTSLMNGVRRMKMMAEDPTIRQGVEASLRTLVNVSISAVDLVPGAGEVASWGADLAKIYARMSGRKEFDLTQDVGTGVAVVTELVEPLTGGAAPSHAVETTLQAWHDLPRIVAAFKRGRELLFAQQENYEQNKASINEAMNTFGVEPPQLEEQHG